MIRRSAAGLAAVLIASAAPAADWPQWMGPNRDGVWAETGIVDAFPPGGLNAVWRKPIAGGSAGPAVAGGKVYVADYARRQGDPTPHPQKMNELTGTERVLCLDAKTGNELWKHEYDCPYKVSYPAGPRCTPTVHAGKVYALGAMGDLVCLDAGTGKELWKKDFKTDYAAITPIWGFAGHPLVHGDLLICLAGGKNAMVVAFDKNTGAEKWKALDTPPPPDGPGYCSPVLIDAGGVKQVVLWHSRAVVGLNPETGKPYWSVPLKPNYGMAIMTPQKAGDLLFAGGMGGAAVAIKLAADRPAVEEAWRGKKGTAMYPVNATPLIEDGVIYGVDQPGQLRAVKLATGERLWSTFVPVVEAEHEEGYNGAGSGTAFLVKNGDRYFLFNEKGSLIIAKLTPQGYQEVSKAKLVEPTGAVFGRQVVWSHPAFADRCVFVRNDKEIACFSLAK